MVPKDGSAWVYGYNDRDELTSAKRYWGDWTPYSGQQFGFEYDNIGNRKKACKTSGSCLNGR